MSETLCKCGAMRMLDPSVSCARGNWIHAVSKCESTCDECAALRAKLSAAERADDCGDPTRDLACDCRKHLAWSTQRHYLARLAAETRLSEALAVLREVEWEGAYLGRMTCPVCGGLPPLPPGASREFTLKDDVIGHLPACRLASLLSAKPAPESSPEAKP